MAFRQRTINGIVVDGDGSPIANAQVKFKPTQPLAYTATHIIVDAAFTVQTDEGGEFTIDIWCDEDSLVPVDFNVYFPVADGGEASDDHRAPFSLEYGDGSPVNLAELINASIPAPEPEELLYEFVNQAVFERERLKVRTVSVADDTILSSDLGKELRTTGAAPVEIIVPSTTQLGEDFICAVMQMGDGQVTFTPDAGVVIRNRDNEFNTAEKFATVSLRAIGEDEYLLTGETA